MNLWLRLLYCIIRGLFRFERNNPLLSQSYYFYITPLDCDINGHLTNSRYFSFMDLCRLDFFTRTGLFSYHRKNFSCFPILQGIEISFISEILPFSYLKIETSILGCDDKYCYIEHIFFIKNKIVAHARARGILVNHRKEKISPERVPLLLSSQNLKESLEIWKKYLSVKKTEIS